MTRIQPDAPIRLQPLYMERVWGGRTLDTLFGRTLPADAVIGESWEIVDRPEAQSIVTGGTMDGLSLHDLWTCHRADIFGHGAPEASRFPLLIKILDARDTLSIQVHPPEHLAAAMDGEPKTEMWYIVQAAPDSVLYAGVQPGVDRAAFEQALENGTAAQAVHALPVQSGDSIFIPSGRLHAIGAGLVIFEIQQNSDTTYRVFDWNRTGLDGRPRTLHVEESLRCIDFTDTAPALAGPGPVLADCAHFTVSRESLAEGKSKVWGSPGEFCILAVASGSVLTAAGVLHAGDFVLMPACLTPQQRAITAESSAVLLRASFGSHSA